MDQRHKRSLNKNLDMQRMLALKAISRADDKLPGPKKTENDISYLLKPNESCVLLEQASLNPSDIFNISDITPKDNLEGDTTHSSCMSQSVQDILAASCLKDVQDSVLVLEDINQQCSGEILDGALSNSVDRDAIINSWIANGQNMQDFSGVSFKSSDDINQRLLLDEQDWKQNFADIPQEVNKLNFSDFSGYLPSDLNKKPSFNDSVASYGEYFGLGSETLNNFLPNRTPSKHKPVAMLNMEEHDIDVIKSTNETLNQISKFKATKGETVLSVGDESGIASLSTIARALNVINEKDSSQTIINTMLKKTHKTVGDKPDFSKPHITASDNSIISGSIPIVANKENSNPNIMCSASSSTLNSTADFIKLFDNFEDELDVMPVAKSKCNSEHIKKFIESEDNLETVQRTNSIITNNISIEQRIETDCWIKPDEHFPKNQSVLVVNQECNAAEISDVKFEESLIMIEEDSSQSLDITIEKIEVLNFPLNCPLFLQLQLHSKCHDKLYITAKFTKLILNNDNEILNTKDFLSVELPSNPVCLDPFNKTILPVKLRGSRSGLMNVTLHLKHLESPDNKIRSLQYSFQVNFFNPHISVAFAENIKEVVDLIDFGYLPKKCSKIIELLLVNKSEHSLPLKVKIISEKTEAFTLTSTDKHNNCIKKLEDEFELHRSNLCKIQFMSGSGNIKQMLTHKGRIDIGLFINGEFVSLKSYSLTAFECHTEVLLNSSMYPLHLEYGETRPVLLKNVGDIDLNYDVYISKDIKDMRPCPDEIFTISETKITIKKGKQKSLHVTLNQELLNSTERMIIFQQTLNGPILFWPVIAKSCSVQNYFRSCKSPKNGNLLGHTSVTPNSFQINQLSVIGNDLENNVDVSSKINSPSKLKNIKSNFKISHNKISPAKSSRSSYGSASTGSQNNERLPIQSVTNKMSWTSVKVGKKMQQNFTIKNSSEHRIKLNINIPSDGFSLVNNNDISNSMTLLLQGSEVRTFSVIFLPQRTGIYCGNLVLSQGRSKRAIIPLVGFGGTSDVTLTGVFKLPNDMNYLSLGECNNFQSIQETVTLFNKGTVEAFALVVCENLKNNILMARSEIVITPNVMVIQPNSCKTVNISFNPMKDCVNMNMNGVFEIATLSVLTGDEGLRQRLRQLYQNNPSQRKDKIWKRLLPLLTNIEGEPYYPEMAQLNEDINSLCTILAPLSVKEICITAEKKNNSDISVTTIDESMMFQSLCTENDSQLDSLIMSWSFEPSVIIFSLPCTEIKTVKISSCYNYTLHFEVFAHPWFKIQPTSGTISKKGCVEITIKYLGSLRKSQSTFIQVFAENDVLNIPIQINTMT